MSQTPLRVAILGDPAIRLDLVRALATTRHVVCALDDTPITDEWRMRKWFSQARPDWTFVGVGRVAQTSISHFQATVQGSMVCLNAAAGFSGHVRLVSTWLTPEFSLLARLADLYRLDWQQDYTSFVLQRPEELAAMCVLCLTHVSPPEKNTDRSQGQDGRGEVSGAPLPEQAWVHAAGQAGAAYQSMLEAPLPKIEGTPSPHVCAEQPADRSEPAGHCLQPDAGRVQAILS